MFEHIRNKNSYGNLKNGEWFFTEDTIEIIDPYSKEPLGSISKMTKEHVDESVKNAKNSQKPWGDMGINDRAEILQKWADKLLECKSELANILMKEIAKDYESCITEVERTADFIRYTADEGKRVIGESLSGDSFPGGSNEKISCVVREPMGLVLAISPFNYPINLSASKVAPAIIAGNSVLLKPPTQGAISALCMVETLRMAGIPNGVINTVTGSSSEIGDYLVTHEEFDFINFTGSTKVGQHIASISGMVPMILELGGKDAAIVLSDANLEDAAKDIVSGAFSYSGQRCTAIKRVLVNNSVADDLIGLIQKNMGELSVGAPKNSVITPLIDDSAAQFVKELMEDAESKGANRIIGGEIKDNLIWPTLYDNVTTDMRLAWEEPFGPVLPIIRVTDVDEAIKIANDSEYGLQSSVFTENLEKAFYVAKRLEVGTIHINNKTERGPDHFPFSGIKNSGMGTQGIKYSIEAMTRRKNIVFEYS